MFVRKDKPPVPQGRHRILWPRILWISFAVIALWICFHVSSAIRSHQHFNTPLKLQRRALEDLPKDCHLVAVAEDSCKWVQQHCDDEEAGLFSYLQLYYCRLPHAKGVAILIMVFWLCLLFSTIGIAASDFFSINLSTIASLLGLSEDLAGVTFLAFGNGSPDVFSTFAAMSTHSGSMAIGELIGAAGFITAVVAGCMALVRPFQVAKGGFVRDVSFFIIASALAMSLIADGQLMMWECIVMVAFYIGYVLVVVIWHWFARRRNARFAREAKARGQFISQETEDSGDISPTALTASGSTIEPSQSRINSDESFLALEAAGINQEDDDIIDFPSQHQALTEINRSMRVSRSTRRSRRPTANPIRPSLVGALEFRSVMHSLQRSRSQAAPRINLRRYSDDQTYTHTRQHGDTARNPSIRSSSRLPITGSGGAWPPYRDEETHGPRGRHRAVSANDASQLQSSKQALRPGERLASGPSLTLETQNILDHSRFAHSPEPFSSLRRSESLLGQLLPEQAQGNAAVDEPTATGSSQDLPSGNNLSTSLHLTPGTAGSSPASPFPQYHDDHQFDGPPSRSSSFKLPPPRMDLGSTVEPELEPVHALKGLRWWPYGVLPEPEIFFPTLFPTLFRWTQKNLLERLLGLISAPSILLLTITLPVVEEKPKDDEDILFEDADNIEAPVPIVNVTSADETQEESNALLISVENASENTPLLPNEATAEPSHLRLHHQERSTDLYPATSVLSVPAAGSRSVTDEANSLSPAGWNRWLVCVQIFMAPFFVIMILWANTDDDGSLRNLAIYEAYAMISSLVVLAIILTVTDPIKPPKYRPLLCFVGFVVSVAWISTIANEVVGVLKALGVILGISEAILGLTVFAVGNSLGDLVANITIARLGFPVMAFSACIGGPMLNILLGIGLGGLYMTIQEGKSAGNEGIPALYQPFEIEVGTTLLISGATLLLTLVGLLIVVPLNKWRMDRKIGIGLLALWFVATTANLALEISGIGRHTPQQSWAL